MAKKPFVSERDEIAQQDLIDRETGEIRVRTFRGSHYEDPDPTPFAPTVGVRPKQTLEERMRQMIRDEMSYAAEQQGMESFEEADDFDVDDDSNPFSEFEIPFEPVFEPRNPAPPRPEVQAAEVKATTFGKPPKSQNQDSEAHAAPTAGKGT